VICVTAATGSKAIFIGGSGLNVICDSTYWTESEMRKFLVMWAAMAFALLVTYGPALAKFVGY
jgi:hypothetical protein